MRLLLGTLFLVIAATTLGAADAALSPTALRCEYRDNPLGLDVPQPRLSWLLEATGRGQRQTAYQVLVARTPESLAQDRGDLWDSGKVASDETTCVPYAGKPLAAHLRCHWKVKVWDKDGQASAWSQPVCWSMGILQPADWKAEWIGYDAPRHMSEPAADLEGAKWIWHAADPTPNAPKGVRLFLTTLTLPANVTIDKAEMQVTGDDNCHVVVNGAQVAQPTPEGWKAVRSIDLARVLHAGVNHIRANVQNAAPGPAGLIAKLVVATSDGKRITVVTDESWKSTSKRFPDWQKRDFELASLPAAKVLGPYGMQPWGKLTLRQLFLPPAVYLRTAFHTARPIHSATVYATALGIYDLFLNGRRVADEFFNPGWTDYTKRVHYRAYDVTSLLQPGENVLGAILADGWYSGQIGWLLQRDHYGKKPRFRALLRVEYTDGSVDLVPTGPGWKANTGAIREADFLAGETVDARLDPLGWNQAGFDAAGWHAVDLGAELNPRVEWHPAPAVRTFAEFRPQKVTQPRPGVYVLDLGQNFAGIPRLSLRGEPGQQIQLRFAERLNPDGSIYTINLRGARATDTYICRGDGLEVWQPRFTFHGFQYIEVTGLKQPPAADTVLGLALSSDTPVVGSFECSDAMLNRLHKNIYHTQRSNFIDIPTDCPQRDERLGWMGDAQVYIRTATLNTDVQAFFTKWLVDVEDGQRADGEFPMIAPVKVAGDDGGPAWADAGVICPWTVFRVYGDRRVLEKHYDSMTRFIAFCKNRSTPDLLPPARFHCFGDWLSIEADTPKDVICTAYFAYSTQLVARAAEVLGKDDDAKKYAALFQAIKAAFNRAYVAADGRIKGNTQAAYVLALAFDLLDADKQKLAAQYLAEDIQQRDWHLSTGFIGTKDLMLALSMIDRNDIAYRLLHNDTFPSWGFSIKHGATSIWERWDGWTPEHGFQTPGMNSFAHYSFGAVYQWMLENIGGIRAVEPGYRRIAIVPCPGGRLTWANVAYRSIRGPIASRWKLADGKLELHVTIPANTTATISVPAKKFADITQPAGQAPCVKLLGQNQDRTLLEVGSGEYEFVSSSAGVVPMAGK